jgi:hypothetical protein
MPMLLRKCAMVCAGIALTPLSAHGSPFVFSTNAPDGRMAMGAIPQTLTADDFEVLLPTELSGGIFYGLATSSITNVRVDVYRVFPYDSNVSTSGDVPTRVNSPADIPYTNSTRIGGVSLNFTTSVLDPSFTANNQVLAGINPIPNQTTGGEGAVNGQEIALSVTFNPTIKLEKNRYYIALQVNTAIGGSFYWLSAQRPIVTTGGGTPFASDQQAWISNGNITPDWLRVGTDIVGGATPPTFNAAFTLIGTDDRIFRNSFDPT